VFILNVLKPLPLNLGALICVERRNLVMIIQRINRTNPEKVFIVVQNGSASSIGKGYPVVYEYDGTSDGLSVTDVNTGAAAKNHLVAGLLDATLAAGAYGLAQCYGVRTDAPFPRHGIATNSNQVVGDAMVLFTASSILSAAAAGAVSAYLPGIVCGQTLASSGTSTLTSTGTVFLRLM
jgi:hypothetical protein